MINYIEIIGFFAAAGTTFAFLPQVIQTVRTKQTKDINLLMYIMFTTGVFLWLVYGLLINSLPVILANVVVFFFASEIFFLKVKHG
jgi:MtN3 and saliva related transmembrane protein